MSSPHLDSAVVPSPGTSGHSLPSVLTDPSVSIELDAARAIVREYYGVDAAVSRLSGERDDNFRVDVGDAVWMLKVAHAAEARAVTDFQSRILGHLAGGSVSVPAVVPCVDGVAHRWLSDGPAAGRAIRMTSFSPGVVLRAASLPRHASRLGATVADLDAALASLDHGGYDVDLLWDLQKAHLTRELIDDEPSLNDAEHLRAGFDRYLADCAPRLAQLPRQVIHNDVNPDNVLVDGDTTDGDSVAGARIEIIDFGDAVVAPRVVDLAVAASYFLDSPSDLDPAAPLGAATDVITGYHRRTPLSANEIELLPGLLLARVLTAVTVASWRAARFPENRDYILRHTAAARGRLELLRSVDCRRLVDDLMERCELS